MKDKMIMTSAEAEALLKKTDEVKLAVCKIALKNVYGKEEGNCPENCPLQNLCNSLISVWAQLLYMQHHPKQEA
jgi:hypothetical protein